MISEPQAARLGWLVQIAMDMHVADRANLAPTPDPRLGPAWKLIGYLIATDCLFRRGQSVAFGEETCYGFLAQSTSDSNEYVAVIRGTEGILEWIEDGLFCRVNHPVAGTVESGFWGIYSSLRLALVGALAIDHRAAAAAIILTIGIGNLTVIGHSLGAPLATYLTFDIAAACADRVQACLFASPRPGNAAFCQAFDARVKKYQLYNYELDVVPRVPRGPDYTDLPRVMWIGIAAAQAKIRFALDCHHHVVCYCAMLDYALFDWSNLGAIDHPYAACIRGPAASTGVPS